MQAELMAEDPARGLTLYDLEGGLCSFATAIEETDDPELKGELLEELGTAPRCAKDKRDNAHEDDSQVQCTHSRNIMGTLRPLEPPLKRYVGQS